MIISTPKITYHFIFLLLLSFVTIKSQAQSVEVKADKSSILIGERLQYDLTCKLPSPGYAINFKFPDSVSRFEVIENNNFDTTRNSNEFLVHKKIIFTSFDSGAWFIPSFEVLIERPNFSRTFHTDSILVDVGYSPADSSGQLRDIKPLIEVTITDYTLYYIAGAVLLAIIIGILLYRYFKNRKQNTGSIFNASLSPFDEAMNALKLLQDSDLSDPVQVKEYHSSLAVVFKRYFSRKLGENMMNRTTGELLVKSKGFDDARIVSALAESLRLTDAVKFAKYIPGEQASGESLLQVKEAIESIEKIHSPIKQ